MSGSPVSLIQDVLGVSGGRGGALINAILLLPKNTTSKQIKE